MLLSPLLDAVLYAAPVAFPFFDWSGYTPASSNPAVKACQLLEAQFPSQVLFPGSVQFASNIKHWANTSSQVPTCSIEPETVDDVSSILRIVGREDVRSPFAIKSGGHAINAGFSSTEGVHISMAKFSDFKYDAESKAATIGVGMLWDEVYARLEPLGVMVVGPRTGGIGVGGLTLGGGFSWKTDQYGLTIDTVISYNLVLPSGKHVHVSNTSYPDLFFGLKGGFSNFGIVTDITFETHPQTLIYGGAIVYSSDVSDNVNKAIDNFMNNNKNPKALVLAAYISLAGDFTTTLFVFYDGPEAPAGTFDEFMSIPNVNFNVKTRTFRDLTHVVPSNGFFGIEPIGFAGQAIPLTSYPVSLLSEMVEKTKSFQSALAAIHEGTIIFASIAAEPFANPFSNSRGGAYPHPPSRQVTPSFGYIGYKYDTSLDLDGQTALYESVLNATKQFAHDVQAKAVEVGASRWDDIMYNNYALVDTPLELIYGSNLDTLRQIAAKYDPNGIMKLAGGFVL